MIELNPKNAGVYNLRGAANYGLKNYAEAIADFTKAIELDPKDATYYDNRGKAYKALGKTKEAEEDFSKAKALEK